MRARVKAFQAPECAYPLTAVRCVSRVSTDYGVFVLTDHGVVSRETYGTSRDDLPNG
jgi:3-oxoadipate CoA-transferase beta subunit